MKELIIEIGAVTKEIFKWKNQIEEAIGPLSKPFEIFGIIGLIIIGCNSGKILGKIIDKIAD